MTVLNPSSALRRDRGLYALYLAAWASAAQRASLGLSNAVKSLSTVGRKYSRSRLSTFLHFSASTMREAWANSSSWGAPIR